MLRSREGQNVALLNSTLTSDGFNFSDDVVGLEGPGDREGVEPITLSNLTIPSGVDGAAVGVLAWNLPARSRDINLAMDLTITSSLDGPLSLFNEENRAFEIVGGVLQLKDGRQIAADEASEVRFFLVARGQLRRDISQQFTVQVVQPPSAPTGLSAVVTSPTRAEIAFDPVNNASGYVLEITDADDNEIGTFELDADTTTFTASRLPPGQSLSFSVATQSPFGLSDATTVTSITDELAPSAVDRFNIEAISTEEFRLTWLDSERETGYRVFEVIEGAGEVEIVSLAADVTEFIVSSLAPGSSHEYRIEAFNGTGTSTSQTLLGETLELVPTKVEGFDISTMSPTSAMLSWVDSQNETLYQIVGRAEGEAELRIFATVESGLTSAEIIDLVPNTRYEFFVIAANSAGIGASVGLGSVTGSGIIDALRLLDTGVILDLGSLPVPATAQISRIDLIGVGDNELIISPATIIGLSENSDTVEIAVDEGDRVNFGDNWRVESPIVTARGFRHILTSGNARIELDNPFAFQNPLNTLDVNFDGSVTASDALSVINALARGLDQLTRPSDPNEATSDYIDVTRDGRVTAADALEIIFQLSIQSLMASPEDFTGLDTQGSDARPLIVMPLSSNMLVESDLATKQSITSEREPTHVDAGGVGSHDINARVPSRNVGQQFKAQSFNFESPYLVDEDAYSDAKFGDEAKEHLAAIDAIFEMSLLG